MSQRHVTTDTFIWLPKKILLALLQVFQDGAIVDF